MFIGLILIFHIVRIGLIQHYHSPLKNCSDERIRVLRASYLVGFTASRLVQIEQEVMIPSHPDLFIGCRLLLHIQVFER